MSDFLKGFKNSLSEILSKKPVIHHITNFVSMESCANIAAAFGASPIMAFYDGEIKEVVLLAQSTVLNCGTPTQERFKAVVECGKEAVKNNIPVVFDPVGVGVSKFRYENIKNIFNNFTPNIIKGNASEIKVLSGQNININKGVDSVDNIDSDVLKSAVLLSRNLKTVVAVTGETDIITDGKRICRIERGSRIFSRITGAGCMTGTAIGVFSAVKNDMFLSCCYGIYAVNCAGEQAEKLLLKNEGSGTFKVKFLDCIYNMNNMDIDERGIYFDRC